MAREWGSGTLSDIADVVMGQSPPGEACNEIGEGLPLLNGPTEFGGHHPDPIQFTTDARKFAEEGDLLFCVRGSTTGRMNWADQRYAIGRGIAAIRAKNGPEYNHFVRAVVDTGLSGLLAAATGSTFPNVSGEQLRGLPAPLPPLAEQKRIAHILGTLDDKIELNRKMNATLEAMARALFKSWFVDFDPVRAKMEGRQPEGMDAETAALFPDSLEESSIGLVPKGWKVERLDAHITAERGLSYKGEGLSEEGSGLPMHNLNSIYEGGGYKHEGIKYYAGEYRERHLVNAGDMIVTNTEQGFDHLLIGHAAIVPKRYGAQGIFSHHIYRVKFKRTSPLKPHYLVELFNNPRWHYWISGFSNGTTINMLPLDALQMPMLVVPPEKLIERFTNLAQATNEQVWCNLQKSATLGETREMLLPKLLKTDYFTESSLA